MRDLTSGAITEAAGRLARRARCILPPERAILLECAFEGEPDPAAARAMEAMIARFNVCAANSQPLFGEPRAYRVFAEVGREVTVDGEWGNHRDAVFAALPPDTDNHMLTRYVPGGAFKLTVAPLDPRTVFGEMRGKPPEGAPPAALAEELARVILEDFQADAAAGGAPPPPIAVGVGFGETAELARAAAALALFRPADRHAPDAEIAAAERQILARLNRAGAGIGSHTALTVAIEAEGGVGGCCAYCVGGPFTSSAACIL